MSQSGTNGDERVFLAGGSGFLGKALIPRLRAGGYDLEAPRSAEYDLTKLDDCVKATKGMDIIVHAAGIVTSREHQRKNPAEIFYRNSVITLQLLEAAKENKIQKIIMVGSIKSYVPRAGQQKEEYLLQAITPDTTDPSGFYGLSKWLMIPAGVAYARQFGVKVRVVVFSNLYGPDDKFSLPQPPLVPNLIKTIFGATKAGKAELDLGKNPGINVDLLCVDDAADLLVRVLQQFGDESFDIVNGGGGHSFEIRQIATAIARAVGFNGKIIWNGNESSPPDFLDITKARRYGWEPTISLNEGLRRAVQWFKQHHEED